MVLTSLEIAALRAYRWSSSVQNQGLRKRWVGAGVSELVQDKCHVDGDHPLGDAQLADDGGGGVAELLGGRLGDDSLRDRVATLLRNV